MLRVKRSLGFTLIELALVLAVLGILLVPLTHSLGEAALRKRGEQTIAALQTAREALLTYAVQHKGCLPFAADYEGGMPDTGKDGIVIGNTLDTGQPRIGVIQRAGDLPWATLSLGGRALDGQQLRIQYYVASAFTDSASGCSVRSRSRIEVWQSINYHTGDLVISSGLLYVAAATPAVGSPPPASPWQPFANGIIKAWRVDQVYTVGDYVNDGSLTYRATLAGVGQPPATAPAAWQAIGLPGQANVPNWQSGGYNRGELVSYGNHVYRMVSSTSSLSPDANSVAWQDISLPEQLLQTRLGPIINTPPGNAVATMQNIAILLAPRHKPNALLKREAMRGANHLICGESCTVWTTLNDVDVDSRVFSLTPTITDGASAQTETILPISLADYQAAMSKANFPVQALTW